MNRRFVLAMLILIVTNMPLAAQPAPGEPIRLTVAPAKEPVPALKYQLLPEVKDMTQGNAAQFYLRALSPEWWVAARQPNFYDELDKWLTMPLADLRKQFPKGTTAVVYSGQMREVFLAARMETCNWDLTNRIRKEGLGMLLPDIQSFRTLANLVALRARIEIAHGEYDKAAATLQTGMALGRHVSEAPFLIASLVGNAISQIMLARIDEWIEQPDAPNLYWALTDLPRTFVDLRRPLQGERLMIEGLFPDLTEAKHHPLSPRQVENCLEILSKLRFYVGDGSTKLDAIQMKLFLITTAAKTYPQAKQALLTSGYAADDVEAMPVFQVALLHAIQVFNRYYDDLLKWHALPYWQSRTGFQQVEDALKQEKVRNVAMEGLPLSADLIPAVSKVYAAVAKLDRKMAALRCVEAVRMYAASHSGSLPSSLEDITEVPVPADPMTGKSFEYKVADGKAVLTGPAGGPNNYPLKLAYEITLRK